MPWKAFCEIAPSQQHTPKRWSFSNRSHFLLRGHSQPLFLVQFFIFGERADTSQETELERSDGVFSACHSNSRATADGRVNNHLQVALALVNPPRSRDQAPAQDNTPQRSAAIAHLGQETAELLSSPLSPFLACQQNPSY